MLACTEKDNVRNLIKKLQEITKLPQKVKFRDLFNIDACYLLTYLDISNRLAIFLLILNFSTILELLGKFLLSSMENLSLTSTTKYIRT